jgi:hypothetical protein
MTYTIHDHDENDALEFDLTGWQPVAHGIRRALKAQRDERYRAHLAECIALADVRHTPEQIEAIEALS